MGDALALIVEITRIPEGTPLENMIGGRRKAEDDLHFPHLAVT